MRTLETLIKMLPGVIIVAAVLALIYQFALASSPSDLDGPPEGGSGLAGWWEWVESRRGSEVVRPVAAADSFVMILGAYGSYREMTAEGVLRSGYGFAEGSLSRTRDSLFTVLVFDTSSFFRSTGGIRAAAIRDMSADSLLLSGTGTDATLHTFVRVRR